MPILLLLLNRQMLLIIKLKLHSQVYCILILKAADSI